MPEYIAPSWVGRPADPALHYGQGFQMGVHLGAQQAAQAFQQQQLAQQQQRMALAQQQQEFENQMQAQVLSLKVGEMVRQHQASQMFQQRVAMGEDPSRVLMELAPSLGESPATILRNQSMRDQARAMMGIRESNLGLARQREQRMAAPKTYVAAQERQALTDLQEQASQLESQLKLNPNDPNLKAQQSRVLNQIQTWYTQHPGGQQISLTTDASGNVTVSMGTGRIQPGAQAAVQREMADLKNSVVQIERARNLITEKDVGVAGVVWDDLLNRWVSQVVPEAGDPSVSSNRVQLQKAADTYLQTQTAKGRLSVGEREDIRNALVSRKAGEALPRARQVLDAMSRIQKFDAITKAKSIQQPLEGWMFDGLSQTEIRQLMQEQILTPTEALEWARKATRR